jgi:hypothetical protein
MLESSMKLQPILPFQSNFISLIRISSPQKKQGSLDIQQVHRRQVQNQNSLPPAEGSALPQPELWPCLAHAKSTSELVCPQYEPSLCQASLLGLRQ